MVSFVSILGVDSNILWLTEACTQNSIFSFFFFSSKFVSWKRYQGKKDSNFEVLNSDQYVLDWYVSPFTAFSVDDVHLSV